MFLQSGGMLIVFKIEQIFIHGEMAEKLAGSKTVFENIRMTKSEFSKSRINSQEIFYQGKMYDIKSSRSQDGIIELLVIDDKKEANILQKIKNLLEGNQATNNELSDQLNQIISLFYISNFSEAAELIFFPTVEKFSSKDANALSLTLEILSPPPKQIIYIA
jgi:hypothetical protein